MYGSTAVRQEEQQQVQYVEKTKVVKSKATISAKEKLLYLFMIVLCVAISSVIVYKYAQIYEMNTNIQRAERQLTEVERQNETLKLEVRKLMEPTRLIEMGKTMGFQPYQAEKLSEVSTSGY